MTEDGLAKNTMGDLLKKFRIYWTAGTDFFESHLSIFYNGTLEEFLSIADDLGIKVIYANRAGSGDGDENSIPEKLGFLHEGIMHVFSSAKDDRTDLSKAEKLKTDNGNSVLHRIEQNPDEEARNMAVWVKSNLNYMSPDSFNLQYFFKKYWERLGIDREKVMLTNERSVIENIEKLATSKIKIMQ